MEEDKEKETRSYAERKYTIDFFKNRSARKDSKSGVLGVSTIDRFGRLHYRSELQYKGQRYNGPFRDTISEAKRDRDQLIDELFKDEKQ